MTPEQLQEIREYFDGGDVRWGDYYADNQAQEYGEALLSHISALEKQLGECKRNLEKYGWHDIKKFDPCNTNGARFTDMECTCGFDSALQEPRHD